MNGHQKQKEQSRKRIEEAVFELMKEKSFTQITVSEIIKRADVARRTFYRLYEGKEDVLRSYFSKLCLDYRSRYTALKNYDIEQIATEYFCFWYQYREFLLLMYECGLDDMLYHEISRASLDVVKNRIGSRELKRAPGLEYFVDYSVGGFINLLHRWIMDGMREIPEKYAENVSKSLLKFIRPVAEDTRGNQTEPPAT